MTELEQFQRENEALRKNIIAYGDQVAELKSSLTELEFENSKYKRGNKMVDVKIKLIEDGILPVFKHDGDACADCYSREDITIKPHTRTLVALGFAAAIPDNYELLIRPRSGLSSKGIDVTLGTGDSSYRGEYKACVVNNTNEDFVISKGDRVCQMAVRELPQIKFTQVDSLDETDRGSNGFGSTGK